MGDFSSDSSPKSKPYHPYQDHGQNLPPHMKLYHLPTAPEYLFEEEALRTRRNMFDNITFYTGYGYLSGSVLGAVKGTLEGLSAAEHGESLKIRANRVLNRGGLVGRRSGNSVGVLGLMYAGFESGIAYYRDSDDVLGSMLAGSGTGALYRIASGFRAVAVASVFGGLAAGAAVSGKQFVKRYLPI